MFEARLRESGVVMTARKLHSQWRDQHNPLNTQWPIVLSVISSRTAQDIRAKVAIVADAAVEENS